MRNYEMIFPFWEKLSDAEKNQIEQTAYVETYPKGMLMHRTEDSCKGLMTVLTGQLRTYILSEEGRKCLGVGPILQQEFLNGSCSLALDFIV